MDFAAEGLPRDFPTAALVDSLSVRLPERAGVAAHGQLFLPPSGPRGVRHPAVVFLHAGPTDAQMLVGWPDFHYYSNAYALNQYPRTAASSFWRSTIVEETANGLAFREADGIGTSGASEYNHMLRAAAFLGARSDVDAKRIGSWGGSYGGYLTALRLARNSDLFAAGWS